MTAVVIADKDIVAQRVTTGALVSGTTYYFGVGAQGLLVESIHIIWDAAIVITEIALEDGNDPTADITVAGAAGLWIEENPTSGVYIATEGAGVTVTNAKIAVAGGAAGGAIYHVGNLGTRRQRLKVQVGATGGILKIFPHGKE